MCAAVPQGAVFLWDFFAGSQNDPMKNVPFLLSCRLYMLLQK